MDSLSSASFTRIPVNSASCSAYCVVNAAGICCTRITAAGKSRVKPGAMRMIVAGPPVEAARTTTGKRRSAPPTDAGFGSAGWDGAGLPVEVARIVFASRTAVRTTRTLAAMRTLRSNSSLTLCMSRSMPPLGLVTNSIAPSSRALSVLAAPSLLSELTTTIGRGLLVMICAVASSPSTWGMFRSIVMTSGFSDSDSAIASRPSLAWPTTCSCSSALKMDSRTFRMNAESSTTSTRNFFAVLLTMGLLTNRHDWSRRLRSDQSFERREELIFLHRLREESGSPFLHCATAVFCARARGNNHHRNPFCRGVLAELGHQFVAGHARHFEVGDHEMAPLLGHKFSRFQSIRRQLHPVSVLFEHARDEFPHADGVVRNHDDAFLIYAVDRIARNRAARHGR